MKYSRWIAGLALAAGMAFPGATALSAQNWRADYYNRDGGERWEQRRDLRHDYARVEAMRVDIARDQARLTEDIRCGRERQAARDAADLARDQRALQAQLRDIQRDRADLYYGRSSYRSGWR
jgi:hypothetical protein